MEGDVVQIRTSKQREATTLKRIHLLLLGRTWWCHEAVRGSYHDHADIEHDAWIEKMFIDSESFVDILYMDMFLCKGYKRDNLIPCKEVIHRFTNTVTLAVGVIDLKTSISSKGGRVIQTCQFVVVEIESTFNEILSWPFIHDIKAVPSSYHQCMRYLANYTIATIKGQQSKSGLS